MEIHLISNSDTDQADYWLTRRLLRQQFKRSSHVEAWAMLQSLKKTASTSCVCVCELLKLLVLYLRGFTNQVAATWLVRPRGFAAGFAAAYACRRLHWAITP